MRRRHFKRDLNVGELEQFFSDFGPGTIACSLDAAERSLAWLTDVDMGYVVVLVYF